MKKIEYELDSMREELISMREEIEDIKEEIIFEDDDYEVYEEEQKVNGFVESIKTLALAAAVLYSGYYLYIGFIEGF